MVSAPTEASNVVRETVKQMNNCHGHFENTEEGVLSYLLTLSGFGFDSCLQLKQSLAPLNTASPCSQQARCWVPAYYFYWPSVFSCHSHRSFLLPYCLAHGCCLPASVFDFESSKPSAAPEVEAILPMKRECPQQLLLLHITFPQIKLFSVSPLFSSL